jgi:hypothetical protein
MVCIFGEKDHSVRRNVANDLPNRGRNERREFVYSPIDKPLREMEEFALEPLRAEL